MDEKKNGEQKTVSADDTTPKVTGIGGIFFFSDKPDEMKEWYSKNLGLETNEYGSSFEFRMIRWSCTLSYIHSFVLKLSHFIGHLFLEN